MKSERRHELKQNSLIQSLNDLPLLILRYRSQVAVGVIVLALFLVWLRIHWNAAAQKQIDAQVSLSEAFISLERLQGLTVAPPGAEAPVAEQREVWYTDGLHRVDDTIEKAGDGNTAIRIQSLLCKGDLNFALADMPDLPGAATQPSLRPELSEVELLDNAQTAYSQVLTEAPDNGYAASAAHFGLAAVAEDLANVGATPDPSQWDTARQQYQAVIDDPNAPAAYKQYANMRLTTVADLEQPAAIGLPPLSPARPAAVPATQATKPTTR